MKYHTGLHLGAVWPTKSERGVQGGRGTTCKRSDSQHSSQTKCQRKRQGKFWQWRRRRATLKIFVVEQISGLRWNCCQIGYKQFLLGSPVYGVVFSGHHQLVLPLVGAVWYFWPAFFTYFSCRAPSLFSFFLSSSTFLASK